MISARCLNHEDRLAAARCLACGNSFCRECVTEHGGRLICAACLRKLQPAASAHRSWQRRLTVPVMAIAALTGSWLLFYATGWWLEDVTAPPVITPSAAQK